MIYNIYIYIYYILYKCHMCLGSYSKRIDQKVLTNFACRSLDRMNWAGFTRHQTDLSYAQLPWIRLQWAELLAWPGCIAGLRRSWNELKQVDLRSHELKYAELTWIEQIWAELYWASLLKWVDNFAESCFGLGRAGLVRAQLAGQQSRAGSSSKARCEAKQCIRMNQEIRARPGREYANSTG